MLINVVCVVLSRQSMSCLGLKHTGGLDLGLIFHPLKTLMNVDFSPSDSSQSQHLQDISQRELSQPIKRALTQPAGVTSLA